MNGAKTSFGALSAALALALAGGCAHETFVTSAQEPEIRISETGGVTYRGETVDPEDLPDLLGASGLTGRDTIHLRIPDGLRDYRVPYYVMGVLAKAGFSRPILVTERHSVSERGRWIDKGRMKNGRDGSKRGSGR